MKAGNQEGAMPKSCGGSMESGRRAGLYGQEETREHRYSRGHRDCREDSRRAISYLA